MSMLDRIRSAFLLGRAFKKFEKKKYNEALNLFKLIEKLTPDLHRKEVVYYHVGMSYHELGEPAEALQALSKAYETFISRIYDIEDENYLKMFLALVSVYAQSLKNIGNTDQADSISRTRDALLTSRGYILDRFTGRLEKIAH